MATTKGGTGATPSRGVRAGQDPFEAGSRWDSRRPVDYAESVRVVTGLFLGTARLSLASDTTYAYAVAKDVWHDQGSTTLASGHVDGEGNTFNVQNVPVVVGSELFLVVDRGYTHQCDTTTFDLLITSQQ